MNFSWGETGSFPRVFEWLSSYFYNHIWSLNRKAQCNWFLEVNSCSICGGQFNNLETCKKQLFDETFHSYNGWKAHSVLLLIRNSVAIKLKILWKCSVISRIFSDFTYPEPWINFCLWGNRCDNSLCKFGRIHFFKGVIFRFSC